MGMVVLAGRSRLRFIEQGKMVIPDIDQFSIGVSVLPRDVENPFGDRFTVSVWAGTADDDSQPEHGVPFFS